MTYRPALVSPLGPRARLLLLAATLGLAWLAPSPLWAQVEEEEATAEPAEPAEETPAEADAGAPPEGVEKIVVTITKREEALQDVASSITAFDAEQLQNANIQNVADALTLIPNVQIKGDGNEAISIRGISQSFTSQSPVAQHMNGLFKFDGRSYTSQFYDLQALEIARGPSGTVYGRNATAGAINLRWNEPTSAFESFGDYTQGNYDLYQFRGGVNLPFSGVDDETLMGRFAFTRESHDGYIDNVYEPRRSHDPDDADDYMVRGSLLSRPSEDLDLHLRSYWTENTFTPTASRPRVNEYPVGVFDLGQLGQYPFDAYNGLQEFTDFALFDGPDSNTNPDSVLGAHARLYQIRNGGTLEEGLQHITTEGFQIFNIPGSEFRVPGLLNLGAYTNVVGGPIPHGDRRVRNGRRDDFPNDEHYTIFGIEQETDWTLGEIPGAGDVALTLLGGYERTHYDQAVDPDGSELLLADTIQLFDNDLFTGEIRLNSKGWESFDWIAGVFWFQREQDLHSENYTPFGNSECGLCPFLADERNTDKGYAPFLTGFYRPIEEVELSAGVRWNQDEVVTSRVQPTVGPRDGFSYEDESARFGEPTGEVAAKWFWTEGKMVYAKGARGYKAGGFNDDADFVLKLRDDDLDPNTPPVPVPVPVAVPFDPEIVWAGELGSKNSFFDDKLHLNLTGFYYSYSDLQVPKVTGLAVITDNAAAATIWGLELEAVTQPFDGLTLAATVGYLNATFDEFCSDDGLNLSPNDDPSCEDGFTGAFDGLSDVSGNRLEDSPEWNTSLYSAYDLDLGKRGTLTPVVEFAWIDEYFLRPQNSPIDRVGDHTKTDVRLIWRSPNRRWAVEGFVENLENDVIYNRNVFVAEFSNMMSGFGMLPPRTFGVRVGFNWGGAQSD